MKKIPFVNYRHANMILKVNFIQKQPFVLIVILNHHYTQNIYFRLRFDLVNTINTNEMVILSM